jgi:cytochrome c biogenesis protein CcmG/thiol:disulfide interchange protein DsbE
MANAGNAQVITPALPVSPIILVLAILCGFSDAARGQNLSAQMRLEKALENARSITNIEIQYDDVLWIKGKPGSPFTDDFTRTSHMTYTASNGKYREECRNESPQTNIVKFTEKAFDGKLWSGFSTGTRSMSQKDGDNPNDGENPSNPLIQPFLFLSRASDDCTRCNLRFTDLRSPNILNGLILPDAQSSNGVLHLSFPGLPLLGSNQLWSIALDVADPDFKPRSISRTIYGGSRSPFNFEATYILSGYTNVGAHSFPTKLAFRVLDVPTNKLLLPTLDSTGMVTLVSVRIPTQIPDSTFQLDESEALGIWNVGQFEGDGVGLILGEDGSNIVVKRITADSPAGRQNDLHVGDRILSIAESNAAAIPVHSGKADLPRASALLQGAKGSAVTLTFISPGKNDSQTRTITLARGEVRSTLSDGQLLADGIKAPDIEMVALTNRAVEHLSDYAGKIVVLEFWASWCSPCQKSMADLQLDPARYPDWKDKVVVIAASVDDTAEIAAKHIEAKGWNQTHNVWLKPKEIETYHVGGIPSAYIIDKKGMIVVSGYADQAGLNIPDSVNRQLDAAGEESKKE